MGSVHTDMSEVPKEYMERRINDFLALDERFGKKAVRKRRTVLIMLCVVLAASLGFIWYTSNTEGRTALLCFMLILLPFMVFLFCRFGRTDRKKLARIKSFIANEGVGQIFADLENAERMYDTSVFAGERYIFMECDTLCRITDVRKIFVDNKGKYSDLKLRIDSGSGTYDTTIKIIAADAKRREAQLSEFTWAYEKLKKRVSEKGYE